ncbi:MAG: Nramp family divalent metal transporter [Planctomycetes bacterium]|nr:Nramp family divalent metal transporter [Planctomycetota bacterium]
MTGKKERPARFLMSDPPAEAKGNSESQTVPAGMMPPWSVGELPAPPRLSWNPRGLIGPGLMMAGAAIGGGEWVFGPRVTAQYGGIVMWLASASILLQVFYNLEVMRYTLYCGEPILTGFFRIVPGPRFWTGLYLFVDFFGIWPYLAAHAAVPLSAALLGHLPGALPTDYLSVDQVVARTRLPVEVVLEMKEHPASFIVAKGQPPKPLPEPIEKIVRSERDQTHWISYGIFLLCFVPLIFGGKIYNSLERIMVIKIVLVLGYLIFLGLFFVSSSTWAEIFAGLICLGKGSDGRWDFRLLPQLPAGAAIDWALLGGFAAIAGQGGLTNTQVSSYARDKGWGMGALVGAIPSMVGGKGITLSHTGKVFPISTPALQRWKGWWRVIYRDQWVIWLTGCILGVAIPSLVSLEFIRGKAISGNQIAAATAQGIVDRTGLNVFWFLTLLCGFIVLVPSHIGQVDGIVRRWTDLIWTGNRRMARLEGNQVKVIYYFLLTLYALWGLVILTWLKGQAEVISKAATVFMNFALGFSSFHTLAVNWFLLPRELKPGWIPRLALCCCGVFFLGLSYIALPELIRALRGG